MTRRSLIDIDPYLAPSREPVDCRYPEPGWDEDYEAQVTASLTAIDERIAEEDAAAVWFAAQSGWRRTVAA